MLNSITVPILCYFYCDLNTPRSEFAKKFTQFHMKPIALGKTKPKALGKTRHSDFWNNLPWLCNEIHKFYTWSNIAVNFFQEERVQWKEKCLKETLLGMASVFKGKISVEN